MDKPKFIKHLGYKIFTPKSGKTYKKSIGLYACPKCGDHFEARQGDVNSGNTSFCASCSIKVISEKRTRHGMSQHRMMKVHATQKSRCRNPNHSKYKGYGGRGITFSEEFDDFVVWYDYVTNLPRYELKEELNLSIDRIDNDRGYERGNLRWATPHEQGMNKRNNIHKKETK